jgi:hypothetical protein
MTHRNKTLSLLPWALLTAGAGLLPGCADGHADLPPEPEPTGVARTVYRISEVVLPPTALAAGDLGLDLDGDGSIDNRLGLVHGLLAERWNLTLSGGASATLRDHLPWLLVVDTHPSGGVIDAWLAPAQDEDPTAPQLDGAIAARGRWQGETAALRGGHGQVPVGALGDPAAERAPAAAAGWCATSLAATLAPSVDGMSATLGLALDVGDVRAAIAGPLAAFLTAALGGDTLGAPGRAQPGAAPRRRGDVDAAARASVAMRVTRGAEVAEVARPGASGRGREGQEAPLASRLKVTRTRASRSQRSSSKSRLGSTSSGRSRSPAARRSTGRCARAGLRGSAPRRRAARRSRLVPARSWKSLAPRGRAHGRKLFSSSARSSIACSSSPSSPISSRKSVPPSALRSSPSRSVRRR